MDVSRILSRIRITNVWKRTLDVAGAMLGMVILSPFWLVIALWIWLDSGRPIFFLQQRLGKGGRLFWMCKFRTMVVNAEHMSEGLFSYANDRRITLPGRYIRLISLDELPQLINVINGDMSLVGPRPPVLYELGNYEDFDITRRERFTVKPGITGLAQISGRNSLSWDQKIEYDIRYIERFRKYGLWEDLRILLLTVWIVVSMRNTIEEPPLEDRRES